MSSTSVHIEEFECVARDTKLGKEEVTRDIPNVGEDALAELDESGIVRIGAEVKPGDILVGQGNAKGRNAAFTPRREVCSAPFLAKKQEMCGTVRYGFPPVSQGIVISARVFARKGTEMDDRSRDILDAEKEKLLADQRDEVKIISDSYYGKMAKLLDNMTTAARIVDDRGKVLLQKGTRLNADVLAEVPRRYWASTPVQEGNGKVEERLERLADQLDADVNAIETLYNEKVSKLTKGDELPPGVIKMVKVYVAIKRKLSVGDKMAGRHGNKGVISRIMPEEDMPYLADGTPVDIVLNPLGVPSRMNVGQILETHLGWAARELGQQIDRYLQAEWSPDVLREKCKKLYTTEQAHQFIESLDDKDIGEFASKVRRGVFVASPVFDGAREKEIKEALAMAGLPSTGQAVLFDGRTGKPFDQDVTVGVMYMLKLHHLVDDKIHARSIGPYSLVTQQPLGGKAQFGGQRLGEMEVWAMEAYGAAYGLQEFLTVKSDDVAGRTRMYESIVKGEHVLESGLPESFNVLLKELQSLCLNVELIEEGGAVREPRAEPSMATQISHFPRAGLPGF